MISAKKVPSLINYLIISCLLCFLFEGIVCSKSPQDPDSIYSKSSFHPKTSDEKVSYQNPPAGFYRTDSIFSFHSPKGYFPALIHNIGEQTAAPFHFKAKQWLYSGAAFGITAALILADGNIDAWMRTQKQKHKWVNETSPVITKFGSNYGVYSVIATGLISAACKNEKGIQTTLLATQAMITSGIWVNIIKVCTGRERPKAAYLYDQIPGGKWHGFLARYINESPDERSNFSYDSFPSGHTATAFSIATVFASQYNDTKAVPVLLYSAATLVGISRMTEHQHWASDVFVGGLIGYLSGKQVVRHFNKTHLSSTDQPGPYTKNKKEFTFIQNGNQIGFSLRW
jgi:membrane-associated phospholipid phosphatase